MKINHKKEHVYAVHLKSESGDSYLYCLQAQNMEHLYNILKQKLQDELKFCIAEVATYHGSASIGIEASKKLNRLIEQDLDD